MCYRFHLKAPDLKKAAEHLRARLAGQGETRHNIAPTAWIAALRKGLNGREAVQMKWGLVPAWSKAAEGGTLLANARSETAALKPSFRDALAKRHCIIPASGFFEWEETPGGKQPWLFFRRDGEPLLFAGLWEHWVQDGQGPLESCAILTTGPNGVLARLHDRMPVILEPAAAETWLDGGAEDAGRLLLPCPDAVLDCYRVDPWMNSVHHSGERCVLPWNGVMEKKAEDGEQLGLGL
jgi:putative SOS response-associated peptidase YedK